MKTYILKIDGCSDKTILANDLVCLLELASAEYLDYYSVFDGRDIDDLRTAICCDDPSWSARIRRVIKNLRAGFHVLYGDRSIKFKPEDVQTINDERGLRSNLPHSRINPWRLVDVALGLLIYLYRN